MRIALVAVLVALSSPAFAFGSDSKTPAVATDATTPPSQTEKSEDQANRKICKRIDASESRLGSKQVCLTAQEWKQRQDDNF